MTVVVVVVDVDDDVDDDDDSSSNDARHISGLSTAAKQYTCVPSIVRTSHDISLGQLSAVIDMVILSQTSIPSVP